MQTMKWMPLLILPFCSSCSSVDTAEAESVRLDFWEEEGTEELWEEEYLDENTGLNIFVNAVNSAQEVKPQTIITTRPLLTLEFDMDVEENRKYHI